MENDSRLFAMMSMVDSTLVFLRREFATMQILEKKSGMFSSVCRSCSDCSAG